MTPWEMWREASRLRYRVERKRIDRLVAGSLRICRDAASQVDVSKSFISVSGGKDSLVMLALVRQVYPDLPVIHFDLANRAMPGIEVHFPEIEHALACRVQKVWVGQYHDEAGMTDNLGQALKLRRVFPSDAEFETYKEFHQTYRFEGSFVGIRADESSTRHFACKKPVLIYKSKSEFGVKWRIAPMSKWDTNAIWAYIIGNDLPVHPAYIAQMDYGIDPDHSRIASVGLRRVTQYGTAETAKNLWPDALGELREDNPDAHFE